jgi:hypothetical protein
MGDTVTARHTTADANHMECVECSIVTTRAVKELDTPAVLPRECDDLVLSYSTCRRLMRMQ